MKILIVGAGGHGRVVLDVLRQAGQHEVTGFIDADPAKAGSAVGGYPVLGAMNALSKLRRQGIAGAIVAIGDNRTRLGYAQALRQEGFELVSAVHPTAIVASSATIGKNVVIVAGAIVGPEAVVEDSALINTAAVVDHECRIGPGVHICPGVLLAGRVEVEEGAFVGLGAKVLPCLKVGRGAVVGAGALVREDVPAGATVVGVPARVIRPRA